MQPPDSIGDASAREDWSGSLEAVFDQHAELRDVVVQMQETADLGVLTGQLERLHELLQSHFEREESDPGMTRLMAAASDEHRRAAAELVLDHPLILSEVRDLIARIRSEEGTSFPVVEREIGGILKRLSVHDGLENELIHKVTGMDPAAITRLRQTNSKALEVNLRRTAVNVVVPEEQKVLLEVTADFAGVYENTKKLLWEINHQYVGWAQTLEDLHRRAMGDFLHHIAHTRAREAVEVVCDLYAKVAAEATPPALRETAIRKFQYYLEKVARDSGDRLPQLLPALDHAFDRVDELFRADPPLAVIASARLKRLAEALSATPDGAGDAAERSLELLATALRAVYTQRLAQPDPADWWRAQTAAAPDAELPAPLAAVAHPRLRRCLERLDALQSAGDSPKRESELLSLPDHAQLDRSTLDAASCVESEQNEEWQNRLARIQWLIRVLSVDSLAAVHEQALAEISHAYTGVLQNADRERLERVVRETFASLRQSPLAASQTSLDLISKIGREVLASGDPEWFDVVVDEILEWDFPSPDFSGFTDEWQVRVNPAHLRAIRTYLSLIEGNPEVARKLIAALVIQLKIGGVFIADTDLFQKDISRLLNSNVGPVYNQVKNLLKIFPAYFNDIGAEGELRDVSSHIDEIRGRKDPLCHFLRKQCHVESNPLLVRFAEEIARFWATGDREPLRPFVPESLLEGLDPLGDEYAGLHAVFTRLIEAEGDLDSLFALDPDDIQVRIQRLTEGRPMDREKAALLFKLRRLIGRKYEIAHHDLLERLANESAISPEQLAALRTALEGEQREAALEILLDVLEHLKSVVTSHEQTEGYEDVYRKRHIAAGIPSMYGRYREAKFEAIGLSFRIESMANALFEQMFAEEKFEFITRKTLLKVAGWLRLVLRALRVEGFRGRGLSAGAAMLDQALRAEGFRVDQYNNILQILSHSVEKLIRIRFIDVFEDLLEQIVLQRIERGTMAVDAESDSHEQMLKTSEAFFRDLIAQSFALQQLDHLLGRVLQVMVQWRERFDRHTLTLLMTYDADRSIVTIGPELGPYDGVIYLGNKGHAIKRMAHDQLPVPNGFIITTEIFRCSEAMRVCVELQREVDGQLRRNIERLERLSTARFGDPERPLLLSVRSGSAISMPGILDTFLNVGMTVDVAEGFGRRSGRPWAAWDAYRRFVQGWGMGHGIERESFNTLMRDAKRAAGVAKKSFMTSEQMQALAMAYRDFVIERGVAMTDDPYEQLKVCMNLVLASWHSETAQSYRGAMRVADEWGTAVIVQVMVYGNLTRRSGTGVVLTCDPRRPRGGEVCLHGDFIPQGQGDDVVSGLVETFPISERQREGEVERAAMSLEQDFPEVYAALDRHAHAMIREQGMFHQEIEFTFEHDQADGLFILQTRDAVVSQTSTVPVFVPSDELERSKVATGIGVAGGALSGRAAINASDIAELRQHYPDDAILLLRPDTVPDDIPLILGSDGMVTAIGGATSHAALVAQRLGRTCVVGCRQLEVSDARMRAKISGRTIAPGDFISINGGDGSIYLGKHPATTVRRHGLA